MNENEISHLAQAINDLRPDWPAASLRTFLHRPELVNRPYRDVAVALTWIATDTKLDGTWASDKPARLLENGPWWVAAASGTTRTTVLAPRRDESCLTCGRHLNACICGEQRTRPESAAPNPRHRAEAIRQQLRKATP
jgi:hypothetical protein